MAFAALFGDKLQTQDGVKSTADVLQGKKAVAIYFSAHWCPPCRGFTPKLAEWYKEDLQAKGLEVVFVSSDKEEAAFKDYFAEMPWVALPYADRTKKDELSKKFKVSGIPGLIILDEAGNVITKDGRSAVSEDPKGEEFPWRPKPITELLDTTFQGKDGAKVKLADLDGKVIALYFSAHWCPPCRGFTPEFAEQYKKIQAAGKPFEVIFVSSDRDEEAFNEYYAEMPWLVLPYEERKLKGQLSNRFGVNGIPSVVLIDTDRSVITTEGRGPVMQDVAKFPFHPAPVTDLSQDVGAINEALSVIVLAEFEKTDVQEKYEKVLEPLAVAAIAKAKENDEDPEVAFFVAKASEKAVPVVRSKCSLEGEQTRLVLLDITNDGAFYLPENDITTEGVTAAIADAKAGKLERKQLA